MPSYRSIHAKAVTEWLQKSLIKGLGLDPEAFVRTKISKENRLYLKATWFISQMPLAVHHYLREIKRVGHSSGDPRIRSFNYAANTVLMAWETVEVNIGHRPKGMNAFNVGFDPNEPKPYLARPSRVYARHEPLQFPEKLPPLRKTHCHGRWIQEQGSTMIKWVEYSNQSGSDMYNLPPNVSRNHRHWEMRTLPNGVKIHSMADLAVMWGKDHFFHQEIFNARDPLGPIPYFEEMYPGRTPEGELSPERIMKQVMDGITHDDEITPVRYGGIYRPATEQELEEDAKRDSNSSHGDGSSLTASPPHQDDSIVDPPDMNRKQPRPDEILSNDEPQKREISSMLIESPYEQTKTPSEPQASTLPVDPAQRHSFSTTGSRAHSTLRPVELGGFYDILLGSNKKALGGKGKSDPIPPSAPAPAPAPVPSPSGMGFHRMGAGDWSRDDRRGGDGGGGGPPGDSGRHGGDRGPTGREGSGSGGGGGGSGGSPSVPPDGGGDSHSRDAAHFYHKKTFAMKPDVKYFKELKSIDAFPEWYDGLAATLVGTGLGATCDFYYTPAPEDQEDFRARDNWLYVILQHRLNFSEGRTIIRRHRETKSGRQVLYDLYSYSVASATTELSSRELLEDLSQRTLDSSYTKTYVEFINTFTTDIEKYNDLQREDDSRIKPIMAMILLQKAVDGIKELSDVRARERHALEQGSGEKFTTAAYVRLLKAEAERLDQRRRKGRRNALARRKVHEQQLVTHEEESSGGNHDQLYEIFKTIMSRDKPSASTRMDSSSFGKLSTNARKLWTGLTPEDRTILLESTPEEKTRLVNVTELTESVEEAEEGSQVLEDADEETNDLEVNNTEAKKNAAHAADLRRSLSSSAARKAPPGQKTAPSKASPSAKKASGQPKKSSQYHVRWGVNHVQEQDSPYSEGEDETIAPNEEYVDSSDEDDGLAPNWPAFSGSTKDYWDDPESSDDEDLFR